MVCSPSSLVIAAAFLLCSVDAVLSPQVEGSNVTIETFIENVKLHDIPFEKRHVNRSAPVTLSFMITYTHKPPKTDLTWFLDGVEIKVNRFTEAPENPSAIFSVESVDGFTLHISLHLRDKNLTPGNYTLLVTSHEDKLAAAAVSGYVVSPPILPLFPKERRVLDGDRLSIFCEVFGHPKPTEVNWRFAHIKPDSMDDTGVLLDAKSFLAPLTPNSTMYKFSTSSVTNDQLIFTNLNESFSGLFECQVNGSMGGDQTLILVNVKDRWAALWPFIGIVIEVTVLVTAILLYERHQLRSEPSKPDAGVGPTHDAPSSNAKMKNSAMQQNQQQNNMTAPVANAPDLGADAVLDNNKISGIESGDTKQDELRQRGALRC
ncbi:unnamed protein product [Dicrocoelium dendriticum]|nr:unnamed protein product [Dicrocoelium dendriticum]